jgi:hypothetical protein
MGEGSTQVWSKFGLSVASYIFPREVDPAAENPHAGQTPGQLIDLIGG